ncbi:hypothetical protein NEPAR06_0182 [Nematocida parisii]|uniref:Polyprenol reductase n=1 Tax=Nematocida parisii (strain ERTm3) TaxID=935791 RepID=I3EDF2_NEMP3|nr:uncharacterized protein NEPG_00577 [Nematocida parisii ERTm1]EIJ87249.1 hypothetical protein NEQG_02584 [Nematocida parisii ERTm3]KAI5126631.1 hypothetical protein NEPAR08_0550 [Nematocida parisii]EIJ95052.1 hypothetical protein NEPG_00577 [Nematocida parisii ERTm1]KAI5127914.1 hypothetical protein NEPAR03_1194 [Nematocida parisii]KAI5142852.1 hypothetical protein NEPAR04_1672 [Nematocida parisii]|eukprot:XP_013058408.1 hypothetical protein NEPG_00577 [Nematocida parisii ERTm1]
MLYEAFFTALIGVSWGVFFLINPLTQNGGVGRSVPSISTIDKDCFIFFYLNAAIFFILIYFFKYTSKSTHLLGIHILRRLIESSVYSYTYTSRMNILHLAVGIIYYPMILMRSVESKSSQVYLFCAGTLLQTVAHYLMFRKKRRIRYLHYISELIIHCAICVDYLNLAWIVSFSIINILNNK